MASWSYFICWWILTLSLWNISSLNLLTLLTRKMSLESSLYIIISCWANWICSFSSRRFIRCIVVWATLGPPPFRRVDIWISNTLHLSTIISFFNSNVKILKKPYISQLRNTWFQLFFISIERNVSKKINANLFTLFEECLSQSF